MLDSQLLFALADVGYFMNLFNMLPLGTLDGGRILGAVSKYTQIAGLAGGKAMPCLFSAYLWLYR